MEISKTRQVKDEQKTFMFKNLAVVHVQQEHKAKRLCSDKFG